jgi:hypothetical protein
MRAIGPTLLYAVTGGGPAPEVPFYEQPGFNHEAFEARMIRQAKGLNRAATVGWIAGFIGTFLAVNKLGNRPSQGNK